MNAICSICGSDMTVQDREGTAFCLSCENAGLRAYVRELKAALEAVEWVRGGSGWWECPSCRAWSAIKGRDRHRPACPLAAALKGDADDEG